MEYDVTDLLKCHGAGEYVLKASIYFDGAVADNGKVDVVLILDGSSEYFFGTQNAGNAGKEVWKDYTGLKTIDPAAITSAKIRAYSYSIGAGNFWFVDDISLTTDNPCVLVPPAAPSDLTYSDLTHASVKLSWTSNSDNEEGFRVYKDDLLEGTFLSSPATITGLLPETTYSFYVTAYNDAGESDPSNAVEVTTAAPPVTVPDAPGNLVSTGAGMTWVELDWDDNSDNEEGFVIVVDGIASDTVLMGRARVTGLTPLTTYEFEIYAYNTAGNSEKSNLI